jgi:hypothetical protein
MMVKEVVAGKMDKLDRVDQNGKQRVAKNSKRGDTSESGSRINFD